VAVGVLHGWWRSACAQSSARGWVGNFFFHFLFILSKIYVHYSIYLFIKSWNAS
jgi:hypothetical protein